MNLEKRYFVYLLCNDRNTVCYVGVTNNLHRRLQEHRRADESKFCGRYRLGKLVHYEIYDSVWHAIAREKQLKGGSRKKKIALIESSNPSWKALVI